MKSIIAILLLSLVSTSANAMLLKCGTMQGRTLWGSFGKRVTSGNPPTVVHFPTELVVFASPTELQDRQIFLRTSDALKVAVRYTEVALHLEFKSHDLNGEEQTEIIQVRVISPNSKTALQGGWTTIKNTKVDKMEQVACSLYNEKPI